MNFSRLLPLALAAAAALTAATASAQTVITSVPYTISNSGKYQLGGNLIAPSASTNAIIIAAPNVILDLKGFFVSGPANNTASGLAVIFVNNVSNVTIQNGTVANNGYGIAFGSGTNAINHLVQDVNVTRCLLGGIYFNGVSSGSILRRNVISQTGGTTSSTNVNVQAIRTMGGVRMDNNVITDVTGTGTGTSTGIVGTAGDFMIGNTVSNSAAAGTTGISGGKYQRNLFINFTTTVTGGVNAGQNN